MTTAPFIIALTTGEPAGIGYELCGHIDPLFFWEKYGVRIVVLADMPWLRERTQDTPYPLFATWTPGSPLPDLPVKPVWHHPLTETPSLGNPLAAHAPQIISLLDHACDGCLGGVFQAMVTAPIQKSTINEGLSISFSGHTEYLAQRCAINSPHIKPKQATMMLVSDKLRVALVTTHLPLQQVSNAISKESVLRSLKILHHALKYDFGISDPSISVCGLNPHAGEDTHLGNEERTQILPAIKEAKLLGIKANGPFSADTLFVPYHPQATHWGNATQKADAILAMYHDQGLPVLKYASLGQGINVTLGLPIVRTSVDHGTALDIAGKNAADPTSLIASIELAIVITHHRLNLKIKNRG